LDSFGILVYQDSGLTHFELDGLSSSLFGVG